MNITEVRIFPREERKLKSYAAITLDNVFVVHNVRIVEGERGLMVCMPSRKMNDGTFRDIAHPISNDFRKEIEIKVLEAYKEKMQSVPEEIEEIKV